MLGGEDVQAREIVYRFVQQFSQGAQTVFIYTLTDKVRKGPFSDFGLVLRDGQKKPSFFAYKTVVEQLKGFIEIKKIKSGQYKAVFLDRKPVYILWGSGQMMEDEITGPVLVVDYLGNKSESTAEKIILEDRPIFVRNK